MKSNSGAHVLVVDDEPAIVRAVELNLRRHQFQTDSALSGRAALDAYIRLRPDLVLLDLGLPDVDGLEIIRSIRAHASTPIVVLSVRGAERDKVEALDLGADDYLTKPFGPSELLARIRVALRHAARPANRADAVIHVGELMVDFEDQRLARCSNGSLWCRNGCSSPDAKPCILVRLGAHLNSKLNSECASVHVCAGVGTEGGI